MDAGVRPSGIRLTPIPTPRLFLFVVRVVPIVSRPVRLDASFAEAPPTASVEANRETG